MLSFQERPGDVFDPVRERACQGKGPACASCGPDYLAYALIDAVVDNYFVVLEQVGEQVEELEEQSAGRPGREPARSSSTASSASWSCCGAAVWPLREVVGAACARESALIDGGDRASSCATSTTTPSR